jgi:hypothetical protein
MQKIISTVALAAVFSIFSFPAAAAKGGNINPNILPGNQDKIPAFVANLRDNEGIQRAIEVKDRNIDRLMMGSGQHAAGISWGEDGSPVIKLLVDISASTTGIPESIEGIPVVIEKTGGVFAMNVSCEKRGLEDCDIDDAEASATTQPSNQRDWHPRPVPIGVSIGHTDVTAGTLGCRVSRGCHQYVLSNAHVIANVNAGLEGDLIIQPGPVDGGTDPTDQIAHLSESVPIIMGTNNSVKNEVDAAIAITDASSVSTITRTNGYGEPKAATVTAEQGLLVQKYGRSSANSHGYIDMLGTTVKVGYNEGQARFVDQIVIKSIDSSDFSRVGDSGALIVIDGGVDDRKAVGLLFASTSDKIYTIANHIDEVLLALDVEIDGEL